MNETIEDDPFSEVTHTKPPLFEALARFRAANPSLLKVGPNRLAVAYETQGEEVESLSNYDEIGTLMTEIIGPLMTEIGDRIWRESALEYLDKINRWVDSPVSEDQLAAVHAAAKTVVGRNREASIFWDWCKNEMPEFYSRFTADRQVLVEIWRNCCAAPKPRTPKADNRDSE